MKAKLGKTDDSDGTDVNSHVSGNKSDAVRETCVSTKRPETKAKMNRKKWKRRQYDVQDNSSEEDKELFYMGTTADVEDNDAPPTVCRARKFAREIGAQTGERTH